MVVQGSGTAWQGKLVKIKQFRGETQFFCGDDRSCRKYIIFQFGDGFLHKLFLTRLPFKVVSRKYFRNGIQMTTEPRSGSIFLQQIIPRVKIQIRRMVDQGNDNSTPSLSDNWTSVSPSSVLSDNITFALNQTSGSRVLYAWYRDRARNISTAATLEMHTPSVSKVTTDNVSRFYNEGKTLKFCGEIRSSREC